MSIPAFARTMPSVVTAFNNTLPLHTLLSAASIFISYYVKYFLLYFSGFKIIVVSVKYISYNTPR